MKTRCFPSIRELMTAALLASSALFAICLGCQPASDAQQSNRRTLRVVVYPFIPRFKDTLFDIKTRFEEQHPDVQLKLIDLSANYYSSADPDYVGTIEADVYELDSVFLAEFVAKKKIQPLPSAATLPDAQLLKNAVLGSTVDNIRYGAPHWVCGNFIFFRADDKQIAQAHTLKDLESAFATAPPKGMDSGLATDLKGKLTLGEFYLEAASDEYNWPQASSHLANVEPSIESSLRRVLKLCAADLCRDHHGTQVYARAFARRKARAFIGYSENLNTVLSQTTQGCMKSDECLNDADIDVAQLSLSDNSAHQISWVDSYVVNAACSGTCKNDAIAFIAFMNADDTYQRILQPSKYDLPAYLLPAKTSIYEMKAVTTPAHLYPRLRSIIESGTAPSGDGLNEKLRADGKTIDGDLNN